MRQVPTFHPAPLGLLATAVSSTIPCITSTCSAFPSVHGPAEGLRPAQSTHSRSAAPSSFSLEAQRLFRSSTSGLCFQNVSAAFVRAYEGR